MILLDLPQAAHFQAFAHFSLHPTFEHSACPCRLCHLSLSHPRFEHSPYPCHLLLLLCHLSLLNWMVYPSHPTFEHSPYPCHLLLLLYRRADIKDAGVAFIWEKSWCGSASILSHFVQFSHGEYEFRSNTKKALPKNGTAAPPLCLRHFVFETVRWFWGSLTLSSSDSSGSWSMSSPEQLSSVPPCIAVFRSCLLWSN